MFSLIQMLFRKTYWQMLLRRATWEEAWMSLMRAHKDRRARKHLLRVLLLAATPVLVVLWLMWVIGSGALFLILILVPIWWWQLRRGSRAQESAPSILPQPTARRELSTEELLPVREFLRQMAIVYAAMVDRAGTEGFLKQKELPENVEVIARRVYLDLLKREDLWDRLDRGDREAMMMPDGHWEWRQINAVAIGLEPLRLMRWMLRVDFYLPFIGQQLKGDFSIAHELVKEPEKLAATDVMVSVTSVENAREAAMQYYLRGLAEEIHRGYREPVDEKQREWAQGVVDALAGKQHEDLVLGNELVSEAEKQQLEWATLLAYNRYHFLGWALRLMSGEPLPESLPRVSPEPRAEEEEPA